MATIYMQMQIRIAPELRAWLEAQAHQRQLSLNATLCAILREAQLREDEQELSPTPCPALVASGA